MSVPVMTQEEKDRLAKEAAEADNSDKSIATPTTTAAPIPQARVGGAEKPLAEARGSGSFKNLNKFIEANRGTSEKFASGVATGLGEKAEQGVANVASEVGKVTEGIKTSTPTFTGLPTDVGARGAGFQSLLGLVRSGKAQPVDTQGVVGAETGLTKTTDLISGTGTQEGLGNVLKDVYAQSGKRASAGEQGFDQLLLTKDVNAAKQMADLRAKAPTFTERAKTEKAKIIPAEELRETGRLGAVKSAQEAIAGRQGDIQGGLEGQRIAAQDKLRGDILGALDTGGNIKMDYRDDVGYAGGINNLIKEYEAAGLNIRDLVPSLNVSKNQFISPEQAAELTALAELSGTGDQYAAGSYMAPDLAGLSAKVRKFKEITPPPVVIPDPPKDYIPPNALTGGAFEGWGDTKAPPPTFLSELDKGIENAPREPWGTNLDDSFFDMSGARNIVEEQINLSFDWEALLAAINAGGSNYTGLGF